VTPDRTKQELAVRGTLERFGRAKRLRLEVELRDRTLIATPVRFAICDDKVISRVNPGASEVVERLKDRPAVKLAACTRRGRPVDAPLLCRARLLPPDDEDVAEARIRASSGLIRRLVARLDRRQPAYVELTPFTKPKPVSEPIPQLEKPRVHDEEPGVA
jgi:PPOX class probable F420-dependent enzyme